MILELSIKFPCFSHLSKLANKNLRHCCSIMSDNKTVGGEYFEDKNGADFT